MTIEIVVGTQVFTADGHQLGRVKRIEEPAFQIDARLHFDYWLEDTLVSHSSPERVELKINQSDIAAYKMDSPHDHNAFQEKTPRELDPGTVRGEVEIRGARRRS